MLPAIERRGRTYVKRLVAFMLTVLILGMALAYWAGRETALQCSPPVVEQPPMGPQKPMDQEAAPEHGPEPKLPPAAIPNVTDPRLPGAGSSWDWGPPP